MGIVQASTKSAEANSNLDTEEPRGCLQCDGDGSSDPGNPGSFQDIHKKLKDLQPLNFQGATLNINKILSNHFRVSHTLTLSPVTPSGYKFGAFYQGTTMIGNTERYPSLDCTIMPNGNQSITFKHTLGCRYRIKLGAQIANNEYLACNTSIDYRSDNCTMSLTLADPDFLNVNGILTLHFLQAISSGLALGVEIATKRDKESPIIGQQTFFTAAARYSTGPLTVSSTIGEVGLHVCCHRRASEDLQLGAEIEVNLRTHDSHGTLVYQLDVPKANFIFRGMIDSELTVSSLFEKKLSSTVFASSLLISGALNHRKGQFRVGVGLNVG